MPYYHVYYEYLIEKGIQKGFLYNFQEEDIRKSIAIPYMRNIPVLLYGSFVPRPRIKRLNVYMTHKPFHELILPNGKSPIDTENKAHINKCFGNQQVKTYSGDKKVKAYVRLCTHDFLVSPPEEEKEPAKMLSKLLDKKKKIFIVHGRDDKQALLLQKYLTRKLELDAIMFDDLPDKGKTIIEQLEYIQDNVGYAIAIVIPDDVGCLVEDIEQLAITMTRGKRSLKVKEVYEILDTLLTRPRQNVIFELGLFISALGRDKVCYLLQKDVQDELSDLHGILHKSFDKSVEEVFHEIADELKEG